MLVEVGLGEVFSYGFWFCKFWFRYMQGNNGAATPGVGANKRLE